MYFCIKNHVFGPTKKKQPDWTQPRLSTESRLKALHLSCHDCGKTKAEKPSPPPRWEESRVSWKHKNKQQHWILKVENAERNGFGMGWINRINQITIIQMPRMLFAKIGRFPWENVKSKKLAFFVEAYLIVGSLTKCIHTSTLSRMLTITDSIIFFNWISKHYNYIYNWFNPNKNPWVSFLYVIQ